MITFLMYLGCALTFAAGLTVTILGLILGFGEDFHFLTLCLVGIMLVYASIELTKYTEEYASIDD